jgi:phosphoribosylaminoimidazole-succinocarboxamide synthase
MWTKPAHPLQAANYALSRGIIIADTKFEFALDEATDEVVLVDEVLTPDSSRFWPASSYKVGRAQESLDKQFLRGKFDKCLSTTTSTDLPRLVDCLEVEGT